MSAVLKLATVNGAAVTEQPTTEQPRKRMQDGFTAIPNGIKAAKQKARLTSWEWFVLDAVESKTFGFNKTADDVTVSQLARMALDDGDDVESVRAAVSKAFNALIERKVISATKGKHGFFVSINPPNLWIKKAEKTPCQNNTPVSKQHTRPCQNNTHNRQPQETTEEPNGSLSSAADKVGKKPASRSKSSPIPVDAVIALYNEMLGDRLPKAVTSNSSRGGSIRARWKEMLNSKTPSGAIRYQDEASGLAWWKRFFAKVKLNPHWMGSNDNGWTASLDWIVGPKNFLKVLEYVPAKRSSGHD